MPPPVSLLTFSLVFAVSSVAHASELPDGGQLGAGMHQLEAQQIARDDFVRTFDGLDAATVAITGQDGLIIDGGDSSTAKPTDCTRGIELVRGKSISPVRWTPPGYSPSWSTDSMHSVADVRLEQASATQHGNSVSRSHHGDIQ